MNSRVSGAYAGLAARYLADHGKVMQSNSSFRSNTHQQILWDRYGHDATRADRPGHSMHQGGLAIDVPVGCSYGTSPSACSTSASKWLANNLGDFGFTRPNSKEAWHVQPPW